MTEIYTGQISINTSSVVKAVAVAGGLLQSDILQQNYILKVGAVTIKNIQGNKVYAGKPILFSCTTPNASIYYKIDDGIWTLDDGNGVIYQQSNIGETHTIIAYGGYTGYYQGDQTLPVQFEIVDAVKVQKPTATTTNGTYYYSQKDYKFFTNTTSSTLLQSRKSLLQYNLPGNYSWRVPYGVNSVQVLVVGSGGDGGSNIGGGAGSGKIIYQQNYLVNQDQIIDIVVGNSSNNSSSGFSAFGSLTASNGYRGLNYNQKYTGSGVDQGAGGTTQVINLLSTTTANPNCQSLIGFYSLGNTTLSLVTGSVNKIKCKNNDNLSSNGISVIGNPTSSIVLNPNKIYNFMVKGQAFTTSGSNEVDARLYIKNKTTNEIYFTKKLLTNQDWYNYQFVTNDFQQQYFFGIVFSSNQQNNYFLLSSLNLIEKSDFVTNTFVDGILNLVSIGTNGGGKGGQTGSVIAGGGGGSVTSGQNMTILGGGQGGFVYQSDLFDTAIITQLNGGGKGGCNIYPLAVAPISGSGTQNDPYQIQSFQNLLWLSQNVGSSNGKFYKQTKDINAIQSYNNLEGFVPIGNNISYFKGFYNGNYKKISNLYINRTFDSYIGLFGFVYDQTTKSGVSNVLLIDANIIGKSYVGGIAGLSIAPISSSLVTGNIKATTTYCGGIVGSGKHLYNCNNVSLIQGNMHCGGIAGDTINATISNCINTGIVEGVSYCGGLLGSCTSSYITCSLNNGVVSGSSVIGGLVAGGVSASSLLSFYNSQLSGISSLTGTAKTTSQILSKQTFAEWSSSVWIITNNQIPKQRLFTTDYRLLNYNQQGFVVYGKPTTNLIPTPYFNDTNKTLPFVCQDYSNSGGKNPISCYFFNSSSNDIYNNNNLTVVGSSIYKNGRLYNIDRKLCVEFDGSTKYAYNSSFNIGTNPIFTICGWVKLNQPMVNKGFWGIGTTGNAIHNFTRDSENTNKISIGLWNLTTIQSDQTYDLNQWCFVVWQKIDSTFTTSSVKMYKNGVLLNNTLYQGTQDQTPNVSNGLYFGGIDNDPTFFSGVSLQDFRIYNRVLSHNQILSLYGEQKYNKTYSYSTNGGDSASVRCYQQGGANNQPYKEITLIQSGSSSLFFDDNYGIKGLVPNRQTTFSCYIKSNIPITASSNILSINNVNETSSISYTGSSNYFLTTEWTRQQFSFVPNESQVYKFRITPDKNNIPVTISVCLPQLQIFSSSTKFTYGTRLPIAKDIKTQVFGKGGDGGCLYGNGSYGNTGLVALRYNRRPYLYYNFDELLTGSKCYDFGGKYKHANLINANLYSPGRFDSCVLLTESNSYIQINNVTFSQLQTCSISFWRKNSTSSASFYGLAGVDENYYIMKTNGTSSFEFSMATSSNTKIFVDGVQSDTPKTDTSWHHYLVTNVDLSSFSKIIIGNSGSVVYSGSIDDLKLFNYNLNEQEKDVLFSDTLYIKNNQVVFPPRFGSLTVTGMKTYYSLSDVLQCKYNILPIQRTLNPVFSSLGNTYNKDVSLKMSNRLGNTKIYYTTGSQIPTIPVGNMMYKLPITYLSTSYLGGWGVSFGDEFYFSQGYTAIFSYNNTTDTLSSLFTSTYANAKGQAVLVDYDIYMIGSTSTTYAKYLQKYNIQTNTKTTLLSAPVNIGRCLIAHFNGKIYLVGNSVSFGSTNNIYVYDIETNTWQLSGTTIDSSYTGNTTTYIYPQGQCTINNIMYITGYSPSKTFSLNLINMQIKQISDKLTVTGINIYCTTVYNNILYLFTSQGLYKYNPSTQITEKITPLNEDNVYNLLNGVMGFVDQHLVAFQYSNLGHNMIKYVPYGNTSPTTIYNINSLTSSYDASTKIVNLTWSKAPVGDYLLNGYNLYSSSGQKLNTEVLSQSSFGFTRSATQSVELTFYVKPIYNNIQRLQSNYTSLWCLPIPLAPSGLGTTGSPYLVDTFQNLLWVSSASAAWASGTFFKQTNNILCEACQYLNSGTGFKPIGSNYFAGYYDGGNYTISNLYFSDQSASGMFFRLYSGSQVHNINLDNTIIQNFSQVAGALACTLTGSINNCNSYRTTISGCTATSTWYAGGMVATAYRPSTITSCSSETNISLSNASYGVVSGFVSNNQATCSDCVSYTTGSSVSSYYGGFFGSNGASATNIKAISFVSHSSAYSVPACGGMVAIIGNSVRYSNCSAHGQLTSSNFYCGGFSGYINIQNGQLYDCYCKTHLRTPATIEAGGMFGGGTAYRYNYNIYVDNYNMKGEPPLGTVVNSNSVCRVVSTSSGLVYFNSDKYQTTGSKDINAKPLTTALMQTASNFFKFSPTIWNIKSGINDGTPFHVWQYPNQETASTCETITVNSPVSGSYPLSSFDDFKQAMVINLATSSTYSIDKGLTADTCNTNYQLYTASLMDNFITQSDRTVGTMRYFFYPKRTDANNIFGPSSDFKLSVTQSASTFVCNYPSFSSVPSNFVIFPNTSNLSLSSNYITFGASSSASAQGWGGFYISQSCYNTSFRFSLYRVSKSIARPIGIFLNSNVTDDLNSSNAQFYAILFNLTQYSIWKFSGSTSQSIKPWTTDSTFRLANATWKTFIATQFDHNIIRLSSGSTEVTTVIPDQYLITRSGYTGVGVYTTGSVLSAVWVQATILKNMTASISWS